MKQDEKRTAGIWLGTWEPVEDPYVGKVITVQGRKLKLLRLGMKARRGDVWAFRFIDHFKTKAKA